MMRRDKALCIHLLTSSVASCNPSNLLFWLNWDDCCLLVFAILAFLLMYSLLNLTALRKTSALIMSWKSHSNPSHCEFPLAQCSMLWFVLGLLELFSGSHVSRELVAALGLFSASVLWHGSRQMKLINAIDESGQGIKDEKRLVQKEEMAFPEVSRILSRLVWVVCFAFFRSQEGAWYLTRKADLGRVLCLEKED